MGRELTMFNGLPSDLHSVSGGNEINAERGLVRGGAAVWNADGREMQKANAQNARAASEDAYNEMNVERGMVSGGGDAGGMNADGESQEKKRGAILHKRLGLINEFLVKGRFTDVPFGAFLKKKRLNERMFLAELPASLQFVGISNETPQSRRLLAYGVAMNKEYETQYLQHIVNTGAEDTMSCDGCSGKCGSVSADGDGAAKVKCNLKYPPPRAGKRKDAYNACLKTEAVKIVEKRDEKKAAGVGALGNIAGVVNKTNPALVLMRNSFLSILAINLANTAKAFSIVKDKKGDHWNKIVKKWVIFGGDLNALKNAIDNGKRKEPAFKKLLGSKYSADGWESADGNLGKTVAAASGAMGTISGILLALPDPTAATKAAAVWTGSAAGTMATMAPILNSFAKQNGATAADITPAPGGSTGDPALDAALASVDKEPTTPPIEQGFMDKYKFYVVGAMVLVSGLAILALTVSNPKGKLAV